MFKEFVGYCTEIISDMIQVRHDKLFVSTIQNTAHRVC